MAFVREIGRYGVLSSGIWPRHRVSNQIDISERVKQLIKSKKRDINDIPIYNCTLRTCYGVSNRNVSEKNISLNRIDKISYQ